METLIDLIRLFLWQSKLKISRSMEYRTDFLVGLSTSLILSCIGPLLQYIIFTQTNGYPGWTLDQIILFQGVLLFWMGIKDTLFGQVRGNMEGIVRNGEFDRLLLKPYPPIGIILSGGFNFHSMGSMVAGIAVISYAARKLALVISFQNLSLFIFSILCGIILYIAITIFYCTLIIKLISMGRLGEIVDKLLRFSEFPVEIFPMITRVLLLTFLPLAIWIYFPAQALLYRFDMKMSLGIVFSLLLFGASLKAWNLYLKKYTSAGG